MSALWSTTVIAVVTIVAAAVALCLGHLDQTGFLSVVGAFGGGTSLLHVTAAVSGKNGGA